MVMETNEGATMTDQKKLVYWQQATTGKLHRFENCSVTRTTRYSHFRRVLSQDEVAQYPLCAKCFNQGG